MKSIKIILISIFTILLFGCSDDQSGTMRDMVFGNTNVSDIKARNYDSFSSSERQSLFWEPFDNNANNWYLFYGSWYNQAYISGGTFILNTTVANSKSIPEIDMNKNFEIEYSINSKNKNLNSLIDGEVGYHVISLSSTFSSFWLGITFSPNETDANYTLKSISPDATLIQTKVSVSTPSNFDLFTYRKYNNYLYVFHNKQFIKKVAWTNFRLNKLTIRAEKGVIIDYIKIDYLN